MIQEEPGESLSDCDKEEEEENTEENLSKADDEDESEDGFFVPDGYLSENEVYLPIFNILVIKLLFLSSYLNFLYLTQGVEVERMDHSELVEEANGSPSCPQIETEELSLFFKQLKHLNTLTEHALKKNRPFVVSNLMHEKSQSQPLSSTPESEQTCLQALSIRAFPVGPSIDLVAPNDIQEDEKQKQEDCSSSSKVGVVPIASGATITDSDLPEIVSNWIVVIEFFCCELLWFLTFSLF